MSKFKSPYKVVDNFIKVYESEILDEKGYLVFRINMEGVSDERH